MDTQYGVGVKFDSRKALQEMKKFRKELHNFEQGEVKKAKRAKKRESEATRHLQSERRKQTKANQTALSEMLRDEERAHQEKVKDERKAALTQKRITNATTRFKRSALWDRMDDEQKYNFTRLAANAKTEDSIRDAVSKTTAHVRREAIKRKSIERKLAADKEAVQGRSMARMNALATATQITVGAAMAGLATTAAGIGKGKATVGDDMANAARAGVSLNEWQQEVFVGASATGMGKDEIAQAFMNTSERMGQVRDLERDKDGNFTGTELSHSLEFLVDRGVFKDNVAWIQEELKKYNPFEFAELLSSEMQKSGMDVDKQMSILEDTASGLGEYYKILNTVDPKLIADMNKSYIENGLGIDPKNVGKVTAVSREMDKLMTTLGQIPVNLFEGFASALDPETTASMEKFAIHMNKLSEVVGAEFANAFDTFVKDMTKFADFMNNPTKAITDFFTRANDMATDLKQNGVNLHTASIAAEEAGFKTHVSSSDFTKDMSARYIPQENRNGGSQLGNNTEANINVTVDAVIEMDKQQVGRSVMQSEAAKTALRTMYGGVNR